MALAKVAAESGCERVLRVNAAAELPDDLFGTVGVTAGASAPEELVEAVIAKLAPQDGTTEVTITDEDEYFPPPRELRDPAGRDGGCRACHPRRRAARSHQCGRPHNSSKRHPRSARLFGSLIFVIFQLNSADLMSPVMRELGLPGASTPSAKRPRHRILHCLHANVCWLYA